MLLLKHLAICWRLLFEIHWACCRRCISLLLELICLLVIAIEQDVILRDGWHSCFIFQCQSGVAAGLHLSLAELWDSQRLLLHDFQYLVCHVCASMNCQATCIAAAHCIKKQGKAHTARVSARGGNSGCIAEH